MKYVPLLKDYWDLAHLLYRELLKGFMSLQTQECRILEL